METAFIVRLLDADGALLAWAKVPMHAKGDGALYPTTSLAHFRVQANGKAVVMSFHWADVNVEWRTPIALTVYADYPCVIAMPLYRIGDAPTHRLPPVTVGSVVVTPATGTLTSSGR